METSHPKSNFKSNLRRMTRKSTVVFSNFRKSQNPPRICIHGCQTEAREIIIVLVCGNAHRFIHIPLQEAQFEKLSKEMELERQSVARQLEKVMNLNFAGLLILH